MKNFIHLFVKPFFTPLYQPPNPQPPLPLPLSITLLTEIHLLLITKHLSKLAFEFHLNFTHQSLTSSFYVCFLLRISVFPESLKIFERNVLSRTRWNISQIQSDNIFPLVMDFPLFP